MIKRKEFTCQRGELKIRGTLYRAEGESRPIAIVSHGFMGTRRDTSGYAKKLAAEGYAAFCFDFCGGGMKSESDGDSTEMSVFTEVEDLKAVIAYAKSLPGVDPGRLVLMGCSQGGFVSALAAADLRDEVEKLILFYPALCIPDDARRGRMIMAKFDPQNIPETFRCGPMKLGRAYAQSVLEMDPFQAIRAYGGPVLIVHGQKDRLVNIDYSRRAAEAYGENATLKEILNGDHGFEKEDDKLAVFYASEFLKDREEILTVDVRLTESKLERNGLNATLTLPFVGTAKTKWFSGAILPDAADVQQLRGRKLLHACADYTLKGTDYLHRDCDVHVVNVNDGTGWKPTVEASSEGLSFLNGADCTACLENRKVGPVVHIYAKAPETV